MCLIVGIWPWLWGWNVGSFKACWISFLYAHLSFPKVSIQIISLISSSFSCTFVSLSACVWACRMFQQPDVFLWILENRPCCKMPSQRPSSKKLPLQCECPRGSPFEGRVGKSSLFCLLQFQFPLKSMIKLLLGPYQHPASDTHPKSCTLQDCKTSLKIS